VASFSIWHWCIVLFAFGLFVIPLWRIVSRAGFPGAFSLLALIPMVNILMLWVFAFISWPNERPSGA
jgi:hypothetical protein